MNKKKQFLITIFLLSLSLNKQIQNSNYAITDLNYDSNVKNEEYENKNKQQVFDQKNPFDQYKALENNNKNYTPFNYFSNGDFKQEDDLNNNNNNTNDLLEYDLDPEQKQKIIEARQKMKNLSTQENLKEIQALLEKQRQQQKQVTENPEIEKSLKLITQDFAAIQENIDRITDPITKHVTLEQVKNTFTKEAENLKADSNVVKFTTDFESNIKASLEYQKILDTKKQALNAKDQTLLESISKFIAKIFTSLIKIISIHAKHAKIAFKKLHKSLLKIKLLFPIKEKNITKIIENLSNLNNTTDLNAINKLKMQLAQALSTNKDNFANLGNNIDAFNIKLTNNIKITNDKTYTVIINGATIILNADNYTAVKNLNTALQSYYKKNVQPLKDLIATVEQLDYAGAATLITDIKQNLNEILANNFNVSNALAAKKIIETMQHELSKQLNTNLNNENTQLDNTKTEAIKTKLTALKTTLFPLKKIINK